MKFSQNSEEQIISDYFGDYVGTLLDIGANDGVTFSNSRALILKGWRGHLVEPSLAYSKLHELYKDTPDIETHDLAISTFNGGGDFNEGSDSLLSGIEKGWANSYEVRRVYFQTWSKFYYSIGEPQFDFISIDTEGEDLNILRQMDLTAIGCKCLCIEHNNLDSEIVAICAMFGLKPIHRNGENLIFIL